MYLGQLISAPAYTPPGKELNPFSQEDAHCWHTNLTLTCVISLWDSVPAHWNSGKKLNPLSQKNTCFSRRCTLVYLFHFVLRHSSFRLSTSSLTYPQTAQPFFSGRCPFFRGFFLAQCYSALAVFDLVLPHITYWQPIPSYTISGLFI